MDRTSEESARAMARAAEAASVREMGGAAFAELGLEADEPRPAHATCLSVNHVNLFYGDHQALRDVSLDIPEREITSFIGPSGCGKSTLLRCFNRMNDYVKDCRVEGSILLDGQDIYADFNTTLLRQRVGMVFQNPDNQIVANVVEEDVAFAPENLGVPSAEIRKRVDDALEAVGMTQFVKHAPHLLSGGQKQRIAIAGVLAMKPECIVLDEATAMLDPIGRREVLAAVEKLNQIGRAHV